MSEAVVVAMIVAIPGTFLGVAALITAMQGNRKAEKTRELVQTVELSLNSRLSQLLETTATQSRAEGRLEEREAGAARETASRISTDKGRADLPGPRCGSAG